MPTAQPYCEIIPTNHLRNGILFILLLLAFFSAPNTYAQLRVDTELSAEEMISRLVGQGVRVTNVRVNCPSNKGRPFGYFTDNTGTLGIADGLVITTGAAKNAVGPNNSGSISQDNDNNNQDPDLATLVKDGEKQFDACVIEFDVEVFADTLTFDYVFGSEEYLEFIKDYHDVFGFFIAGPGIPGKVNLAKLPGSGQNISVANVNRTTNSEFYRDNGTGSTPFENLFVQYDGFTRRLESRIAVIPCQKYSLKLAICDVKDNIYDAGIFIAGKSLRTKAPLLSYRMEYPKFVTPIEGCNGFFVKITRQSRLWESIQFQLQYSGTATRDADFGPVPDFVSFQPGEREKEFFVSVPADQLQEGTENLNVELINPCPGLPPADILAVPIRESFDFDLPDLRICAGDSIALNPSPDSDYDWAWSPSSTLTCSNCMEPRAFPPVSTTYTSTITHRASGCKAEDTLRVQVDPIPTAAFAFFARPDFSSLDVIFENQSLNADRFDWSFGDGGTSTDKNPTHYYSAGLNMDSVEYPIVMRAINSALGCSDSASARVKIGNPLFIPNLVTDNQDGFNDAFFIRGIEAGKWSIIIYNRWGKEVYQNPNYRLDWTGRAVDPGVYFYELKNPTGERSFRGWIVVERR